MSAFIKSIEYYLPDKLLSNEELAVMFPEWNAKKIFKKTGISSRHIAADNETAGDMAIKAAERLFSGNPELRDEVDFVLFCTQSPDYKLPTTACIIQDKLGLKNSVGALDFNLGCSGYVYGLSLAKGLIMSGSAKNVLLLTGETYSKYCHEKDKGNRSIFGDGASATIIAKDGFAEIKDFVFGTDGKGFDNLIVKTQGAKFPDKTNDFGYDEGGYVKSSDFLYMNGPEIFNFTLDVVPKLVDDCLKINNLQKSDVGFYVFHQANKYMLETLREVLQIAPERFYINLSDTGNTVSSTVPIALKRFLDNNLIANNQYVMTAGFGVGLSYAACVLKF